MSDCEKQTITPEEALAIVEARKQQRIAECFQALRQVLKTHGCRIEAQVIIRGQNISSHIVVLAE